MERGTVQHYNRTGTYGFLVVAGRERDVFFHLNDGVYLSDVVDGEPVFNGPTRNGAHLRPPRVGDELVFEVVDADKGPKATPWSYASAYDEHVADQAAPASA